jgi:hypothetical protein
MVNHHARTRDYFDEAGELSSDSKIGKLRCQPRSHACNTVFHISRLAFFHVTDSLFEDHPLFPFKRSSKEER